MSIPPIIPVKRRVRRKRRDAEPEPTPPPASVTVVSVVWIDEQHAQWSFSLPVVSVEDSSGLLVGGQEPDTAEPNADGIQVSYSSGVSIDDPWEITPGLGSVSITFGDGGGTLVVPESGNVV